jgi:hypothetical protein
VTPKEWSALAQLAAAKLARLDSLTRHAPNAEMHAAISGLDATAAAELAERQTTIAAKRIRELVTEFGREINSRGLARIVAIDPGGETLKAWRLSSAGIRRCGRTVEASSHELAIVAAARVFGELRDQLESESLPPLEDAELIAIAGRILDWHLDREGLAELPAWLRVECSAAMGISETPEAKPTRRRRDWHQLYEEYQSELADDDSMTPTKFAERKGEREKADSYRKAFTRIEEEREKQKKRQRDLRK